MKTIHLIRHGECLTNIHSPKVVGGRSCDSPLTTVGVSQAKALGDYLGKQFYGRYNHRMVDQIWSSTAVRALLTAEIAYKDIDGYSFHTTGVERFIITNSNLQEMSQGDWEGVEREKCYTPEVMDQIHKDPMNFKAPNGESKAEVAERMDIEINKIIGCDWGIDRGLAIFTHGIAIKCWLQKIMGFDPEHIYTMSIDNASITTLFKKDSNSKWMVDRINFTPY